MSVKFHEIGVWVIIFSQLGVGFQRFCLDVAVSGSSFPSLCRHILGVAFLCLTQKRYKFGNSVLASWEAASCSSHLHVLERPLSDPCCSAKLFFPTCPVMLRLLCLAVEQLLLQDHVRQDVTPEDRLWVAADPT